MIRFRDRADAGRQLGARLQHYANRPDVVVLALPRGGVPVAFEVAQALHAPLDVFQVRKLGMPGHEEWASGAIASGDILVLNDDVVHMAGDAEGRAFRGDGATRASGRRHPRVFPEPALARPTVTRCRPHRADDAC
jgi:putative phosphoribosyl transferase